MNALSLSDEHLAVIDRAIAELPYRVAAPLVTEINRQLQAQRDAEAQRLEDERGRNRTSP